MTFGKISFNWQQALASALYFSEKELDLFNGHLERVTYDQQEYLLQPGQTENYLYFIVEGTLKAFILRNNKPICIDFAISSTMFCSFTSFLSRRPSPIGVQSLAKGEAYRVHYDNFTSLANGSIRHSQFSKKLAEAFYTEGFKKEILFTGLDAQQRYQALLDHQPVLGQLVPIKDLATYLGIHPESLSRLRRKIYSKDQ